MVAFHLGTIDEPREGSDIGTEHEDDVWWTYICSITCAFGLGIVWNSSCMIPSFPGVILVCIG